MQLKLRRSQKSGLTGTVSFMLYAIVDLTPEEDAALKKYKFGKQNVYESPKGEAAIAMLRGGGGIMGLSAAIAAKATNQILTVNDLVKGKEITCKDIGEMIAAEEQIREGCQTLSRFLFVCEQFDGEEIVDIEPFAPAI